MKNSPSSSRSRRNLRRTVLLSGVMVTLLLSVIYYSRLPSVEYFLLKSTDVVSQSAEPFRGSSKVTVVAIDNTSLEQYGQWPWSRERLARLLATISDAGAAAIGVDLLLSEQQAGGPEGDTLLAGALSGGPFSLGYAFLFEEKQGKDQACQLHPVYPVRVGRKGISVPYGSFHVARDVVCSLDMFMASAAISGFLNGTPDSDGLLRRVPLMIEYQGRLYPSLPLSLLEMLYPVGNMVLSRDTSQITSLYLGGLTIPTDNEGNFLLRRTGTEKDASLSAADVLEGRVDSALFEDTVVLVGITAAGLTNEYATPYSPTTPALQIYQQALESLLSGKPVVRTPDFVTFEVVVTICFSLVLIFIAIYLPIPCTVIFGFFGVGLSWLGAGWAFRDTGYLFSPLLPTVTLIFNTFLFVTLKYRHFHQNARVETDNALSRLEVSKKDLKSILTTVPDIIYRLDRDAKITFVSPAVEQYSVTIESLLGKSIFDLVSSTDINRARNKINEQRTGERATTNLELRLRLSKSMDQNSRGLRYFSVSAGGIYTENERGGKIFTGTQGIIRDINEHKQLEVQLMKAQKLEVMGNLAARVAHDLNNILSGLVSYPDLLLHEMEPDDPMYRKIAVIRKSGKKAANIVQDLLTLARRSAQMLEVCDVAAIITDYLESIEFQQVKAKNDHVQVVTNLQDGLMKVKGSEVHLSKAIMNIVNNSVEAMVGGGQGELAISASDIYLDTEHEGYERIPKGEYVCVTVRDTGVGIDPMDLQRVFEPFYTKKSHEVSGTGLGMSIIWATVKDHSGYIDIESTKGEGTTFSMYLPATREKSVVHGKHRQIDDFSGTETVLVVDDAADQLDIARTTLQKLGYVVLTAESGEQAVRVMEQHPVDLVLLDMVMPGGLGGLATFREIASKYPNQKGVVTSGFFDPDSQEKLRELGVDSFLEKPYTVAKLGLAIRQELDRSQ
ncbi:CHASE2 domain-containing protein [Desulfopila sp. IMCC35008]|uniref:CHASE2 domain-containing protein n=1 Tax=Desulfopila sp. IMCC35008 TaxID=2653858 RepID=UPI0013D82FD1|nr:CHASE2 domain-containing protein [Desulfopila sp. IMCC35008]